MAIKLLQTDSEINEYFTHGPRLLMSFFGGLRDAGIDLFEKKAGN